MRKSISKYITLTSDEEDNRLYLQNKALRFFDHDIYKKTFEKYADPLILDIGCGTGNMMGSVLEDVSGFRLFGVDEVERQILKARQAFPTGHFYTLNVESADFFASMKKIMIENAISSFDVINCSMVILHLKDPVSFLAGLKSLLSDNGTLIIRDVDDGLHFAWPDPDDCFHKFCRIVEGDARLGDRHCGRKIFGYLKEAGFNRIRLEREGLSTADTDKKSVLYDMLFPDTFKYIEKRHLDNPGNKQWEKEYIWYRDNFDLMTKMFGEDGFIFSIGFMSFTASK